MSAFRLVVSVFGLVALVASAQAGERHDASSTSPAVTDAGSFRLAGWTDASDTHRGSSMGARTASLTADNDDEVMTMSNRRLTEDEVAARQSVDAYNSLEDGQPGDPGTLELQLEGGWVTATGEHDVFPFLAELQYNGSGSEFLENTQFTLGVPVEMGIGGVEGNGDLELGWQQRWIEDDGTMPTIATLAEVRIPTGYHSSGVDGGRRQGPRAGNRVLQRVRPDGQW